MQGRFEDRYDDSKVSGPKWKQSLSLLGAVINTPLLSLMNNINHRLRI
jgi:hypothetical protein